MIPIRFPEANRIVAMGQDQYEPLALYDFNTEDGRVACCFRLTDAEIDEIVRTRTLWLQQLTFWRPFTPIALSVQRPDDLPPSAGEKP